MKESEYNGNSGTYKLSTITKSAKFESDSGENEEENELERGQWGASMQYLMSCIAFSVGLGNVWRFPYTAYENGGGAFLVPYIIIAIIVGKPFYYMEMTLGQFTSRSCVKIWSISPAFTGIGYGVTVAVFTVVSYYCVLMAITLYYLILSFQSPLPWYICRTEWGGSCVDDASIHQNITYNVTRQSSAELFFINEVLNERSLTYGIGTPSWKLVLCLFISWIVIFGVLSKGIKSSGKASYFLAIFPYVIMIALLIRAVTLEGAMNGIAYLFRPDWHRILDPTVWYAAITQCFYSLGVCLGAVIMYSSYNDFKHDSVRYCLIITSLDLCTSLMAGTTTFGILGNLAHQLKIDDFRTVVRSGTGLAFISYPEALAKFSIVPQFFSVLFFLMLFVLGVGSVVAMTSVIISVIKDQFSWIPQWKIALVVCSLEFAVGIIYCTPSGQSLLNLADYYGVTFIITILAAFEVFAVSWIYGVENFSDDIEFMIKKRPSFYWRICWQYLTPVMLFAIFIYFIFSITPLKYNNEFYPSAAYAAGWTLFAIGIIPFPILLMTKILKNKSKPVLTVFKTNSDWGPSNANIRKEWRAFKESKKRERLNNQESNKILRLLTVLRRKF